MNSATVLQTSLSELQLVRRGKVRDVYAVDHERLLIVATDRISAFDCVLPTRLGRNGTVWSGLDGQRLDLSRRAWLGRGEPIVADCICMACTNWSVGAIAALYQSRDPLAYRLASMHNLTMLGRVARDLRRTVLYTADTSSMLRVGKASDW